MSPVIKYVIKGKVEDIRSKYVGKDTSTQNLTLITNSIRVYLNELVFAGTISAYKVTNTLTAGLKVEVKDNPFALDFETVYVWSYV